MFAVARVSPTPSQDGQTSSHPSADGDSVSAPTSEVVDFLCLIVV